MDGISTIPGPVATWWYRDALKVTDDSPTTLLIVDDNERAAGHTISWMLDLDNGLLAYTGDKTVRAASMACTAACQEPVPPNYRLEMQGAMRLGVPKGIPLYVHYTLETARKVLENEDRTMTVKEEQRLRREKAELQRQEAKAKREQEKAEKKASQPSTSAPAPAPRKKTASQKAPKPKPAPPEHRTREEMLRDRAAAGLPAGKSMKSVREALHPQIIQESSSEESEGAAGDSDLTSEPDYSPPPMPEEPSTPLAQPTPPRKPRPSRPVAGLRPPARKRPLDPPEDTQADRAEDPITEAEPTASQKSAAQELLDRVHRPEESRKKSREDPK